MSIAQSAGEVQGWRQNAIAGGSAPPVAPLSPLDVPELVVWPEDAAPPDPDELWFPFVVSSGLAVVED